MMKKQPFEMFAVPVGYRNARTKQFLMEKYSVPNDFEFWNAVFRISGKGIIVLSVGGKLFIPNGSEELEKYSAKRDQNIYAIENR